MEQVFTPFNCPHREDGVEQAFKGPQHASVLRVLGRRPAVESLKKSALAAEVLSADLKPNS